jgi:branched-chain amino acid transport system substrate-binding protein
MNRPTAFLVFLTACVGNGCTPAASSDKVIKVGIIVSYSGSDASNGEAIDRGAELYLALHQPQLPQGIRIELIKRDDTGANPDVAKRLTRELLLRERIHILSGGQWTPNVSAMAPLATEAKMPFVLMASGTAQTTRLSPYIIRFGFTQWQHSYHIGKWAAENGIRRAATLVSDYASGLDAEAAFTRGFSDAGGTVISSIRAPLRSADYVPFLERVRRQKPDALYAFNPGGPEATRFIKAYKDLGLAATGIRLIGPGAIVPDDELRNMGDAALGVISAAHYSAWADRPANRDFVREWKRAYGAASVPSFFAVGGWDGMAAIVDLIRQQNGEIDPERTLEILKAWANPVSPRGPIRIDPETRDIIQNIYIRRVEKIDNELRNVEFATIAAVKDPWKQLYPEPRGQDAVR